MALSITELTLQSTEYLPAREVMTSISGRFNGNDNDTYGPSCNLYEGGILNGVNVQDVVSDVSVDHIQVGLLNVQLDNIHDVLDAGTANEDFGTSL